MKKDVIDWKAKYKEAAEELEAYENDQTPQQLKQLVGRLSVGIAGQSPELDSALKALQPHLHSSSPASHLPRAPLDQVDLQLRVLDQQRAAISKQLSDVLLTWISRLKQHLPVTSPLLEPLQIAERNTSAQLEDPCQLPSVISELVGLQEQVIAAITTLAVPESEPVNIELTAVEHELISLIDLLSLNDTAQKKANQLSVQIREGLTSSDLLEALKGVVELARIAHSSTNEDFENYLMNLHLQLAEVQNFLQDNCAEHQSVGDARRVLEQRVRDDVGLIQHAVTHSNDLRELKQSVTSQLTGIVDAMEEYRRSESLRDTKLQERHDALMARVQEMELETQQVRTHMEEERKKARTDALTGLPNRAAYDDHMNQEFERWQRYEQGFAVAVGDLDFFKRINDTYGHLAGDKVLRLVARVLSRNLRRTDFIARFGGEEFVVLMPSTAATKAQMGMDKLRQAIGNSPFNFHGQPVTITMSFGVTEIREGDTLEQLFERADKALYRAKEEGRNRVCVA